MASALQTPIWKPCPQERKGNSDGPVVETHADLGQRNRGATDLQEVQPACQKALTSAENGIDLAVSNSGCLLGL